MRFSVKISAVTKNKSAVTRFLIKLLGPDETSKAHELVKNGGIVISGLNERMANAVNDGLRDLGVTAQIIPLGDQHLNGGFKVKLLDPGSNKIAVVKAIRKIAGLGLKEAKELVDNLGDIISLTTKEEAQDVKRKLTSVGAEVSIVNDSKNESEPADRLIFAAKINGNPAEFVINLEGDVSETNRVSNIKFGRIDETDNNMNTLFSLSVSDVELSKLEGVTMIVKYTF